MANLATATTEQLIQLIDEDPTRLAGLIDHTLLKPDATEAMIAQLCREAIRHQFVSVCINPTHVSFAAEQLQGSAVKVCTVIGFPLGATTTKEKVSETLTAIEAGASEIDMVINIGAVKSKDDDFTLDKLRPLPKPSSNTRRFAK